MGFGDFFKSLLGPLGLLIPGGDKKKTDPYAALLGQLQPLIDTQRNITTQAGQGGLGDIATARTDYDYISKYLKSLFEGSDDQLLSLLDASGATKSMDENEQMLSEFGVRGGRRAAELGQNSFDRDAALNTLLKQLRFAAPDKLANIAQGMGNLGLGQLSASVGAGAGASNILFGVEGLKQADKDRRAALINSIFSAIGSTAGAIAGSAGGGGG